MDGSLFLPGDIFAENIPRSLKIPDPGIHLGNNIYLRFEDLLDYLNDKYVGQIWNNWTENKLKQELHELNDQLINFNLPFHFKYYFFPHISNLSICLHENN